MGALKLISAVVVSAVLVAVAQPAGPAVAPAADQHSLFAQSAARLLARDFNRDGVSYLLLDVNTATVLALHWEGIEAPVPVGSLVKPFTALAYGSTHAYRYPRHVCGVRQCWLPRGHGRQDLTSATANSCNAYFRALAAQVAPEQIVAVARDFNLDAPSAYTAATYIGVGRQWPLPPLAVAHAYAELAHRRAQPGVADILEGLRRSAVIGTGAEVGHRLSRSAAMVKTGTAPCSHRPRASADGFVVALFPADNPAVLLLLRVHGVTGAGAAVTAGQILHAIEEGPSVAD